MAVVSPSPVRSGRFYVVACRDSDVAALRGLLGAGPIPREQPGDPACAYLAQPITKPWGHEVKFYEDVLSEAWLLAIAGGCETSMHAHARKTTILVCLDGEGWLTTGDGERIELVPGVVVLVMPGALHRSSTSTGVWLCEFESPKDKYDLIRCSDAIRGARSAYEPAESVLVVGGAPPAGLEPLPDGPPQAFLRGGDVEGRYRFGVERGADVKADPAGLRAAISIEMGLIWRGEFAVLTASDSSDAADDAPHLTIRRVAGED